MKTSGVSCETKFGLLVFLGHPNAGHCFEFELDFHEKHILDFFQFVRCSGFKEEAI